MSNLLGSALLAAWGAGGGAPPQSQQSATIDTTFSPLLASERATTLIGPTTYLLADSKPAYQNGAGSFYQFCWVRCDHVDQPWHVWGKWSQPAPERVIFHNPGGGGYEFYVSDGTAPQVVTAYDAPPAEGQWVPMLAGYDHTTGNLLFRVGGGETHRAAFVGTPTTGGATPLEFGFHGGIAAEHGGAVAGAVLGKDPEGGLDAGFDDLFAFFINDGDGLSYHDLTAGQLESLGIAAWFPLWERLGNRHDLHSGGIAVPAGTPGTTAGPIVGTRLPSLGEPVRSLDGATAIGGPLTLKGPWRVVEPSEGSPGVSKPMPAGLAAGRTFDVFFQARPTKGVAEDLGWLDFDDGSYHRFRIDAGLILHVDSLEAGGEVVTHSATGPAYGQTTVASTEIETGRTSHSTLGWDDVPPEYPDTQYNNWVVIYLSEKLDVVPGSEVEVAGAGELDGIRYVRDHQFVAGKGWRLSFHVGDTGEAYAPTVVAGGTVTPTGWIWQARGGIQGWTQEPRIKKFKCFRFIGSTDSVSFQCNDRGVGIAAGDVPPMPGSGGTQILGTKAGGTIPAELPRRFTVYSLPLSGAAEWHEKSLNGIVMVARDDHSYAHFSVHLDYVVGCETDSIAFRQARVVEGVAGDFRTGKGTQVYMHAGSPYQETDTQSPVTVALFGPRWSDAGAFIDTSLIGEVEMGNVTRRARPVFWLDDGPGDNSDDGRTEDSAWKDMGRAVEGAPPGALIKMKEWGGGYGGRLIQDREDPICFASATDGVPLNISGGGGSIATFRVYDSNGVGFYGMRIRSLTKEERSVATGETEAFSAPELDVRDSNDVFIGNFSMWTEPGETPGYAFNPYRTSRFSIVDGDIEPTDVATDYAAGYGEGNRNGSIVRVRCRRKIVHHWIRLHATSGQHIEQFDTHEGSIEGETAARNVAMRFGACDANMFDNWLYPGSSFGMEAFEPSELTPPFNLTDPNPGNFGQIVENCDAGLLTMGGHCGARVSGFTGASVDILEATKDDARQGQWPGMTVFENCQANTPTVDASLMRNDPAGTDFENVTPYNVAGDPIAPGLADLGAKAGRIAVRATPVRGGTPRRWAVAYVDDVVVESRAGTVLYLPATPGSHTVRFDAHNAAGTVVTGAPLVVNVA